jgi:aminopeptidase N
MPTAVAKAAAWASLVDRADLSNRTQEMVAGGGRRDRAGVGLTQRGQAELLTPYAERYWDVVADLWANRTMEIARTLVTQLYPRWDVRPYTLARTDAFLAATDRPPALRRLLTEARADVARALAARERDARD